MENEQLTEMAKSIISQAPNWNFEGDCSILQWMERISQTLENRAKTAIDSLDKLSRNISRAQIALENTQNNLTALQDTQYVEMRCQEESIESERNTVDETKPTKSKIDVVHTFLDNNLKMLHNCHEKFNLTEDSDEDDSGVLAENCIYQPRNPYNDRLLPHIFGTKMWKENWHVGLCDENAFDYSGDEKSEVYSISSASSSDHVSLESHQTANTQYTSSTSLNNDKTSNIQANEEQLTVSNAQSINSLSSNTPSIQNVLIKTPGFIQKEIIEENEHRSEVDVLPVNPPQTSNANKKSNIQCKTLNLFDDNDYNSLMSEIIDKSRKKVTDSTDLFSDANEIPDADKLTVSQKPTFSSVNLFDTPTEDVPAKQQFNANKTTESIQPTQKPATNFGGEKEKISDSNVIASKEKLYSVNLFDSPTEEILPPLTVSNKNIREDVFFEPKPVLKTKISAKSLFDDDKDDDDDFLSLFGKKPQLKTENSSIFEKLSNNPALFLDENENSENKKTSTRDIANNNGNSEVVSKTTLSTDEDFLFAQPLPRLPKSKEINYGEFLTSVPPEDVPSQSNQTEKAGEKLKFFEENIEDSEDEEEEEEDEFEQLFNKSIARAARDAEKQLTDFTPTTVLKSNPTVNKEIAKVDIFVDERREIENDIFAVDTQMPIKPKSSLATVEKLENNLIQEKCEKIKKNIENEPKSRSSLNKLPIKETTEIAWMTEPPEDLPPIPITVATADLITQFEDDILLSRDNRKLGETVNEYVESNSSKSDVALNIEKFPMDDNNSIVDKIIEEKNPVDNFLPKIREESESSNLKTPDASKLTIFDNFSPLFLDEPPDDDDFFHALSSGNSNNIVSVSATSQDSVENDFYESNLESSEQEKSSEAKSEMPVNAHESYNIRLFNELPPDDEVPNEAIEEPKQNSNNTGKSNLNSIFTTDHGASFLDDDDDEFDEPTVGILGKKKFDSIEKDETDKVASVPTDTVTKEIKTSPQKISKLKMPNININVQALLPTVGGKPKRSETNISDIFSDKSSTDDKIVESIIPEIPTSISENKSSQKDTEHPHLLPSLCKNRVRAPVKRKSSTRAGRQESYQKTLLDTEVAAKEEATPPPATKPTQEVEKSRLPRETEYQAPTLTEPPKNNTLNLSSSTSLFSDLADDIRDGGNDLFNVQSKIVTSTAKLTLPPKQQSQSMPLFDDAEDDLFASTFTPSVPSKTVKKTPTPTATAVVSSSKKRDPLFGSDSSDDDDLFGGVKTQKASTTNKLPRSQNVNPTISKPIVKSKQLFSDSESEDDLFGSSKSKAVKPKTAVASVSKHSTDSHRIQTQKQPKEMTLASETTGNPLADLLDI